jgi:chromosome segregation ATPase
MSLKQLWTKITGWLHLGGRPDDSGSDADLDHNGLMREDAEMSSTSWAESSETEGSAGRQQGGRDMEDFSESRQSAGNGSALVSKTPSLQKQETVEKLQGAFNKLVEKLQSINENLQMQMGQHRELISHLDKMPELVKSFPAMVENQEKIRQQLSEQLSDLAAKNEQFIEAVEKIPAETKEQTDLLEEMNDQFAVVADAEKRMVENFKKFNEVIVRLNQNTVSHTDSINLMSKTFAASDRYFKYIISKQGKQFMWLLVVSLGICFSVVVALVGIIIYLARK